jgi:translocator protein
MSIAAMLSSFTLPPILLDIPRKPILAIGVPMVLGSLSGAPTSKVVQGPWYKVSAT